MSNHPGPHYDPAQQWGRPEGEPDGLGAPGQPGVPSPAVPEQPLGQPSLNQPPSTGPESSWQSPGQPVQGQPYQGQQFPGQPYQGQQFQGQQPYPQQPYTQQPYAQQPYGQMAPSLPYGQSFAAAPRTTLPLVLVGCAFAISVVLSAWSAAAITNYYYLATAFDRTEASNRYAVELLGSAAAQLLPTALGIGGLVLGVRAMGHPVTKSRGRLAMIAAIVAPIVSFVIFISLCTPAVS